MSLESAQKSLKYWDSSVKCFDSISVLKLEIINKCNDYLDFDMTLNQKLIHAVGIYLERLS